MATGTDGAEDEARICHNPRLPWCRTPRAPPPTDLASSPDCPRAAGRGRRRLRACLAFRSTKPGLLTSILGRGLGHRDWARRGQRDCDGEHGAAQIDSLHDSTATAQAAIPPLSLAWSQLTAAVIDGSCVSGTGGASGGGSSSSQPGAVARIEAQIQVAVAATEYATAAQLKQRLDALKASVRSCLSSSATTVCVRV